MSLQDDIDRGARVEKLLKDKELIRARDEVARVLHEAWEAAPIRDREGAHELKLMLKALGDVWALLERAVTDGKIALAELEQMRRRDLSPAEFKAAYR